MHDDIRVMPQVPQSEPPQEAKEQFKTPDEVASHDVPLPITTNVSHLSPTAMAEKTASPRKHKFWPLSKKQRIIAASSLGVLLIVGLGAWYISSQNKTTVTSVVVRPKKANPVVAATPTTVASTLSGLPVAPSVNQHPITAVMIENTPQARPQSGLSQAGVVFEALTEGGISRFMALYQDQLPTNVGPVRSVRPYYIDWALGFDAPLAHDGGSPQALTDMTAWGAKNLDEMFNGSYYRRSSSRPAPHNLYTSIPGLITLEANKGWTTSSYAGLARKTDQPMKNPNATTINFDLSYSTYNVQYIYNAATNSYNRSENSAPQIDANTNKQLSPKVVIGMVVPWNQGPMDTSNAYYSNYQTIGSGQAYVFQDGTLTLGQWSKTAANAPLTFTTTNGQALQLNAGQTWITALATNKEITYN